MAYPVSRHAAGVFGQWHEDQWKDGGAHIPRHESEFEVREAAFVDVPGSRHLFTRGAVCTGRDAAEDRSEHDLSVVMTGTSPKLWAYMKHVVSVIAHLCDFRQLNLPRCEQKSSEDRIRSALRVMRIIRPIPFNELNAIGSSMCSGARMRRLSFARISAWFEWAQDS